MTKQTSKEVNELKGMVITLLGIMLMRNDYKPIRITAEDGEAAQKLAIVQHDHGSYIEIELAEAVKE